MPISTQQFNHLLVKFRDEPSHSISFEPCLGRLMDSLECRALTEVLHDEGFRWERRVATPTLWSMLPDERGLYMFVWCPELMFRCENRQDSSATDYERLLWVMYVGKAGVEDGQSDTLKQRFKNGYAKYVGEDPSPLWNRRPQENTRREELLARYLTVRPLEFWYLVLEDVDDIRTLEKRLIKALNPPLNKQHGRRLILGKPEPA